MSEAGRSQECPGCWEDAVEGTSSCPHTKARAAAVGREQTPEFIPEEVVGRAESLEQMGQGETDVLVPKPGREQAAVPGHCISIDGEWWHEPGMCPGATENCNGRCCTAPEGRERTNCPYCGGVVGDPPPWGCDCRTGRKGRDQAVVDVETLRLLIALASGYTWTGGVQIDRADVIRKAEAALEAVRGQT